MEFFVQVRRKDDWVFSVAEWIVMCKGKATTFH